ncbi:MAG: tRNA 2-thiouridine(34) synthase MnmA [Syntrophales bacterium]
MKKVLAAMSGGVDSSVAAFLLKEEGYEVTGMTMCLGVKEAKGITCCGQDAIEDARRVCDRIGIPHYVMDFSRDLDEKVISKFIAEYLRGRTPNPCIDCNRYIKFGTLLEKVVISGFDFLATGHYAKIERDQEGYSLKRPKDRWKDQTYFLYPIEYDKLKSILFPLGSFTKEEVRKMARKAGLAVAGKKESQDLCFVTRRDYQTFVSERTQGIEPGPITDVNGKMLGRHKGIAFYTIGQRGGLGISHKVPLYVVSIDGKNNKIIVGEKKDLQAKGLVAGDLNILARNWPSVAYAKIRYRKKETRCKVSFENNKLKVLFDEKEEAITPGQSVVFYHEDRVLGGGVIERVIDGDY